MPIHSSAVSVLECRNVDSVELCWHLHYTVHTCMFIILCRPVLISLRLSNNPLFLSWSQIIQLICISISTQLQLAGYLVEIILPRFLGPVNKISRYLAKYPSTCPVHLNQPEDSQYMRKCWARYLELISWGRVWVSRSSLELMKMRFVTLGLFPKSELAGYLAISSWWRHTSWESLLVELASLCYQGYLGSSMNEYMWIFW